MLDQQSHAAVRISMESKNSCLFVFFVHIFFCGHFEGILGCLSIDCCSEKGLLSLLI